MGSGNRNVLMVRIFDGSGVFDVKKGIKYHIEKRRRKEVFLQTLVELLIAVVIAVALGLCLACYLLHKVGYV